MLRYSLGQVDIVNGLGQSLSSAVDLEWLSFPLTQPLTSSITARTTPTPTIDTLDCTTSPAATTLLPISLQRRLRHPTNTRPRKIRLLRLHAP